MKNFDTSSLENLARNIIENFHKDRTVPIRDKEFIINLNEFNDNIQNIQVKLARKRYFNISVPTVQNKFDDGTVEKLDIFFERINSFKEKIHVRFKISSMKKFNNIIPKNLQKYFSSTDTEDNSLEFGFYKKLPFNGRNYKETIGIIDFYRENKYLLCALNQIFPKYQHRKNNLRVIFSDLKCYIDHLKNFSDIQVSDEELLNFREQLLSIAKDKLQKDVRVNNRPFYINLVKEWYSTGTRKIILCLSTFETSFYPSPYPFEKRPEILFIYKLIKQIQRENKLVSITQSKLLKQVI